MIGRAEVSNTEHLRRSAANLKLLASIFETNAVRSGIDAWTFAELRLLDAIEALETEADARDGVWELPFRKLVPSRPGTQSEYVP